MKFGVRDLRTAKCKPNFAISGVTKYYVRLYRIVIWRHCDLQNVLKMSFLAKSG